MITRRTIPERSSASWRNTIAADADSSASLPPGWLGKPHAVHQRQLSERPPIICCFSMRTFGWNHRRYRGGGIGRSQASGTHDGDARAGRRKLLGTSNAASRRALALRSARSSAGQRSEQRQRHRFWPVHAVPVAMPTKNSADIRRCAAKSSKTFPLGAADQSAAARLCVAHGTDVVKLRMYDSAAVATGWLDQNFHVALGPLNTGAAVCDLDRAVFTPPTVMF